MSLSFTVGINTGNRTNGHNSGARRPSGQHSNASRNDSIFGQKPDFGPGVSRNHGKHYGLELDSLRETHGSQRSHKHHRNHGSERFAETEAPQKHTLGKKLGGIFGALAAVAGVILTVACPLAAPATIPLILGGVAAGGALLGTGVGNALDKGADRQERQEHKQIYHTQKHYDNRA